MSRLMRNLHRFGYCMKNTFSHRAMSTCPLKAVIFDYGGVIACRPRTIIAQFESANNIPYGAITELVWEHFDKPTDYWMMVFRGEITTAEFEKKFSKLLSDKIQRQVVITDLFDSFFELFKPRPEMLEAVESIRQKGLKTALLTNNFYSDTKPTVYVDRKYFDVITESCRVGLNKPDPRIYELCLKELNVKATDAVFLDDMDSYVEGAKSVGLKTIKVEEDFETALDELEALLGFRLRRFSAWSIVDA